LSIDSLAKGLSSSLVILRPRDRGGDEKQAKSPDGEWDCVIRRQLHFQSQINIRVRVKFCIKN
jgi:hypothetical protein